MLTYSHWSPTDRVPEVDTHVRAHLSAVATPDDDPMRLSGDAVITRMEQDGGVLIIGELNAEPDVDYLREDWTPEQDITRNPLSVPPIEAGP